MVVSKTPGPGQYEIPTTLIGSLAKNMKIGVPQMDGL